MGHHTFDSSMASALEDESRFQFVSVDELLALLGASANASIADVGSGTGFYTDRIAPYVGTVCAIDLQPAMHAYYAEKASGVPTTVDRVTADVGRLPMRSDTLDGAFSTMTFHEFAEEGALAELERVLVEGSRFAVADWSAEGTGEVGPPQSERYDLAAAEELAEAAGFSVRRGQERRETFVMSLEA